MAVTVASIRQAAVAELAESEAGSFGTHSTNRVRYDDSEIERIIYFVDGEVAGLILASPGNGYRNGFFATTAVTTSGTTLPAHIGEVESVVFAITGGEFASEVMGERMPMSYMTRLMHENRNPQGLTLITPKYIQDNDTFFHNRAGLLAAGASVVTVTVKYCTFTGVIAGTNIQSPDAFANAILKGALAILYGKDGWKTDAAQASEGQYQNALKNLLPNANVQQLQMAA